MASNDLLKTGAAAIALAFMAASASAATVNIATDEGDLHVTQNGFDTNTSVDGDEIDGMTVIATYVGGLTETLTWGTISGLLGGVSGSGLDLTFSTGSYNLVTSMSLASLELNAATGNAVFDILSGINDGTRGDTLGTKIGYGYSTTGGDALEGAIGVTYLDGVIREGLARGTDIFTRMVVDYTGLTGGGLLGTTLFRTDLDNLAVAGDIAPVDTPDMSEVPLPAGMPLLLAGLGVLGFVRRKRA
ncbi:VPLPA-CTERM sorting domain-containing protein [Silicimonas algicola]|uniref:Putative secreted protein n=1 Tax=Silicimonas algicola TaxID=1826607 RepID=A0A316GE56_9RHOB|nr:VPLPA-CTERM sorting domain-containing protein [Silicimonas algicola]AZQ66203.1 VPLPA-CTERM sorting domain-containing protein [Silicimonas algicola]PWK58515.1 putative secreted protein [Silicimonas algicola]